MHELRDPPQSGKRRLNRQHRAVDRRPRGPDGPEHGEHREEGADGEALPSGVDLGDL